MGNLRAFFKNGPRSPPPGPFHALLEGPESTMKNLLLPLSGGAALLGAVSCASIVGKPVQTIPITSEPTSADVVVTDEAGVEVFRGTTPASVTFEKSTGKYWGGKTYTVTFSKPGFTGATVKVTHHANGWYLAGNLVFGGVIGWFAIDPWSGKMYTLSPNTVNGTLRPSNGAVSSSNLTLPIVLTTELPPSLLEKLVPLQPQS